MWGLIGSFSILFPGYLKRAASVAAATVTAVATPVAITVDAKLEGPFASFAFLTGILTLLTRKLKISCSELVLFRKIYCVNTFP